MTLPRISLIICFAIFLIIGIRTLWGMKSDEAKKQAGIPFDDDEAHENKG